LNDSNSAHFFRSKPRSLPGGQLHDLALLWGWAIILATAMSTQFLFQPFIWRNFALTDIFASWIGILRDRVIVAVCIVAALALLGQLRPRTLVQSMILHATAIVIGATAGEGLLQKIAAQDYNQDPFSFAGRVVRWTLAGGAIATMIYVWRTGSALAAAAENARVDEARLRRVAASTQLELLKRQIEPHFLFNTLATIRRLQQIDAARSQRLLGGLLDYMSATLDDRPVGKSLGDELRLVVAYLEVCAARMAGPLLIRQDVPPELEQIKFPPLALATLAENAIKHGIDANVGGEVVLSARRHGDMVAVTITDTGVGFSDKTSGSGIGLANVSERLRLIYGPEATLRLSSNTPHGVRATILVADRGEL
jgi:hypothetical protein